MFASLHTATALLPDVAEDVPRDVLGRDTDAAIRAGVVYAARYGVEGLVRAMRERLAGEASQRIPVLITGGGAPLLLRAGLAIDDLRHEPALLAQGAILYLQMSA
jgi:pantothenate kinase type III